MGRLRHMSCSAPLPFSLLGAQVLIEECFPQLERLKLSLKARDVNNPQAHSRNRPTDAVLLTTSNLPGINWGTAIPSAPPLPDVRVDDLLDIIQHGPGPSQQSQSPQPPQQTNDYSLAALPPAPTYQPKYASSSNDRRHALFTAPAAAPPSGYQPQQPYQQLPDGLAGSYRSSAGAATFLPRYPGLEAMQQLAITQALPPTSGPSLGPQEIGVTTVPMDLQGRPETCTHPHPSYQQQPPSYQPFLAPPEEQPSPLPEPPTSMPLSGGPKELQKRAGLRDVHVSVALMEEFLAYARNNTIKGIESCGILAGRLSANDSIFTICTLIIPKQQGTTDTVQALNEEEIFEVQFSQELYPMGWIHTHPTQTCFLSSVDVHTQCGYQTMLDEAVAIVMAPTDRSKKCGIFRLSTPGGLQLVQRCNLRGFHAHPQTSTGQELYELCGHVFLNPRAKHTVIDLR